MLPVLSSSNVESNDISFLTALPSIQMSSLGQKDCSIKKALIDREEVRPKVKVSVVGLPAIREYYFDYKNLDRL